MEDKFSLGIVVCIAALSFLLGRVTAPPHCASEQRQLAEEGSATRWEAEANIWAWRERMTRLRSFRVKGPMKLQCLSKPTQHLFEPHWPHFGGEYDLTGRGFSDGRRDMSRGQVPGMAHKHMQYVESPLRGAVRRRDGRPRRRGDKPEYEGTWVRRWSAELVDELTSLASRGERINPADYPYAALLLYRALDDYPVRQKDVLVVGSVSPWVEAIALSRGARSVTTVDYMLPESQSPRIQLVPMQQLRERPAAFDIVLSFSSVEHDGLGRYGDPIDPTGDIAAVGEFAMLLRPGGTLYLGLPVGAEGRATQGQRIYNQRRFEKVLTGWELLATFAPPLKWKCCPFPNRKVLAAAKILHRTER